MSCGCSSGNGLCGCSVNTIILPQAEGTQGLQGVPGPAGSIGPQGPQGPAGPAGGTLIVVPCVKGDNFVFSTTSSTYVGVCNFIFPGTTYFGDSLTIKVSLASALETTCSVRITTATISTLTITTVVEKSFTISPGGLLINELGSVTSGVGTLSNLPTGDALFLVSIKRDSGDVPIVIHSVMVQK